MNGHSSMMWEKKDHLTDVVHSPRIVDIEQRQRVDLTLMGKK